MYFIADFDIVISLMQAKGLLNSFESKTVTSDMTFVVKMSKKMSRCRTRGRLNIPI